jgi:hypothetical protein
VPAGVPAAKSSRVSVSFWPHPFGHKDLNSPERGEVLRLAAQSLPERGEEGVNHVPNFHFRHLFVACRFPLIGGGVPVVRLDVDRDGSFLSRQSGAIGRFWPVSITRSGR